MTELPLKSQITSLPQSKITKLSTDSGNYKFTPKPCEIIELPPPVNDYQT